jgi:hypothetical protein
MTGDQGNVSKHLLEKMALSKVKAAVQKFSSRPNSKSSKPARGATIGEKAVKRL